MSQEDELLTAALDTFFDDPPPPTSVNAERLLERGRRLLHRRRTARSLSAVAVIAVAALLVTTLPSGAPQRAQPGISGDGAPLINPARFGWLPDTPISYTYLAGSGSSTVFALWGDETLSTSPQLTLLPADGNQVMPDAAPAAPLPADEQPTRVGTIDGNPAWYFSYNANLQGALLTGSIVWRTASGYWAVLTDPEVNGPTLLHIAATADTTPTPFKVPLLLSGDLAGLSTDEMMLTQPLDHSGLEYSLSGELGTEQLSVSSFAGDTGLSEQNGTKCDYVVLAWMDSYQRQCLRRGAVPDSVPFSSSAVSAEWTTPTALPSTPPARTTSPSPLFVPHARISQPPAPMAFRVLDGIDVYVDVYVDERHSLGLADLAITQITSLGMNPADWQKQP